MAAIMNFPIFPQNLQYTKMLENRARAILAKFLTHRVSVKSSLSKFQRIFHLPKMAAILNFRFFFKTAKHKNACISETVLDTAISTKAFDL